MDRPPAHAAATVNPEAGCTPPHGARAPGSKAAPPPSAPTYPPQSAWPQFRTYIPPRLAPESAPASASSPPYPAAKCSTPHSTSGASAHRAHPRRVLQLGPTPQLSQSVLRSTMDHSQNVHTADRQTTAASSSSQPQPPFC